MSGLDAVANRRNPPNLSCRTRTSCIYGWRRRDAHGSGNVGTGMSALIKPPWANKIGKSYTWDTYAPTCAKFRSWAFRAPGQRSEYFRAFSEMSGSPQPRTSSICAVKAPTARPPPSKTKCKQLSEVETPNFRFETPNFRSPNHRRAAKNVAGSD